MPRSTAKISMEDKNIIKELGIILKQVQFHNSNNATVMDSIEDFLNRINPIIETEGIQRIDLIGDIFYLNNTLVKYSMETSGITDYLISELKERDLGTVSFIEKLSADDMKVFIETFKNSTDFKSIRTSLNTIHGIDVERLKHIKNGDDDTDKGKSIIKTYFNAVSFTKDIMSKMRAGEKVSTKNAKRAVSSLVDIILEEEHFLMGLTTIKDFDEYTFYHCVNVSVLSMTMGQRIGLNRKELLELGFAALFHDIGKTLIPKEILNKPGAFTEFEWDVMKKHPYLGTISILKMKKPEKALIRNAIVALEHHMNYDLSGFPELRDSREIDLYSNIVTITDRYDAMTASRVYSKTPFSPSMALHIMKENSDHYDPHLLRLFINMVGVFPVGSLVYLDSGEMGLVYKNDPPLHDRPKVVIIVNASGEKVDGFIVDLKGKNSSGKYVRSIVKTLDPNKYRINLAQYLL